MVSKIFLNNLQKNYNDMLAVLERIRQSEDNVLLTFENCLMEIDATIRRLKEQVRKHQFDSIAEEVCFFKELKPKFVAEFIFYTSVLEIESNKPQNNIKMLRRYYANHLKNLESSNDKNRDFYNYYSRGATYLDHKYFVRHSYDLKMQLPQLLYSFDDMFTTSHDFYVAQFIANEKVLAFVNQQMSDMKSEVIQRIDYKKLEWSSAKVNLVELIYAIHLSKAINSGSLGLNNTIKIFEDLFNIDLHNFHKILTEIKSRKNSRTKFINQLQETLNQYLVDSDE